MTLLNTIGEEIVTQFEDFIVFTKETAPNIIIALLITLAGYFLAKFLGYLTQKILYKLNLDKKLRRPDLKDSLGKISLAKFFGKTVMWAVFLLFLTQGLQYLPFGIFTGLFSKLILWLPKLIFGVVVIIFGIILIDFISYKVLDVKWRYGGFTVQVVKVVLIIAIAVTAVDQLGVDISFLKTLFLIVFGAFALMASLAFGISMGFGLKDDAKKWVHRLKRKR
ncbi:MAG: hypothetical protein KJ709_02445 [Nanoarchaeota archaeon]|nr:hypothetical protein [Nanoarchaeota archaeon]